jgi:hypothetical protein
MAVYTPWIADAQLASTRGLAESTRLVLISGVGEGGGLVRGRAEIRWRAAARRDAGVKPVELGVRGGGDR